jgi:hypothetical protein
MYPMKYQDLTGSKSRSRSILSLDDVPVVGAGAGAGEEEFCLNGSQHANENLETENSTFLTPQRQQ